MSAFCGALERHRSPCAEIDMSFFEWSFP